MEVSYGIRPGAEQFPLMVVLSVSFSCNAECVRCPYQNSNIPDSYRNAVYMPENIFHKIADEAGQYGAWIRLSGREPTLHPELIPLIRYAKQIGCKVALNTNGSMLDRQYRFTLLDTGIDAIEVSVDTADPDTYSQVRKGLDFGKLVKNVCGLVELRDSLNKDCNIVASIVDDANIHEGVDYIVSFWKSIVDNVAVRKYLTWGFLDKSKAGDSKPYLAQDEPCPFPFERLNIDTRGDIFFCGYDIAGKMPLGNVMRESIVSVWRGQVFEQWRAWMLAGQWEKLPLCKNCTDRAYRSWTWNWWAREEIARIRRSHVG